MLHRRRFTLTILTVGLLLMSRSAYAQYGAPAGGSGYNGAHGAFSNLEQMEKAGPDRKAKSDPDLIKEAKRKITDADPRVRP